MNYVIGICLFVAMVALSAFLGVREIRLTPKD